MQAYSKLEKKNIYKYSWMLGEICLHLFQKRDVKFMKCFKGQMKFVKVLELLLCRNGASME
jgi:hypothetical protein